MPARPKNPLGRVCDFVIGVRCHETGAAGAQSHDLYPTLQLAFLFSSADIFKPGGYTREYKSGLLPKH
jgi:hypothetical protein